MGGGGEFPGLSVGKFLSHSAENFRRGEPFSVSLISVTENVWIRGGWGVSRFSAEVFVSLYRNISLGNTLMLFQKNSFIENFHA